MNYQRALSFALNNLSWRKCAMYLTNPLLISVTLCVPSIQDLYVSNNWNLGRVTYPSCALYNMNNVKSFENRIFSFSKSITRFIAHVTDFLKTVMQVAKKAILILHQYFFNTALNTLIESCCDNSSSQNQNGVTALMSRHFDSALPGKVAFDEIW